MLGSKEGEASSPASRKRRREGSQDGRPPKVRLAPRHIEIYTALRVHIKMASLSSGFLVLSNDGRAAAVLDGWTLKSGSEDTLFTVPMGTTLQPRCAVLFLSAKGSAPEAVVNAKLLTFRTKGEWTSGVLIYDGDGDLVDGEGTLVQRDSPLNACISRAEAYYQDLVSQFVSEWLYIKSPGVRGPKVVSARNVRFTHDTRLVRPSLPWNRPRAPPLPSPPDGGALPWHRSSTRCLRRRQRVYSAASGKRGARKRTRRNPTCARPSRRPFRRATCSAERSLSARGARSTATSFSSGTMRLGP